MNFSIYSILKNLLCKLPTIALLVMVIIGIDKFNPHPKKISSSSASQTEWAEGYKGEVPVILELTADNRIDTVKLGQNDETRAYIKKLQREGFFDSWDGMSLVEVEQAVVEGVSGATYSSDAIIANVRAEAARLGHIDLVEQNEYTAHWWAKQVVAWMVLGLAIVCYLIPARMKRWRWVLLIATVGVLGFWQGTFLSIEMLYNYVINGSSLLQITLSVILVLSIAAPLLFNRSFYCQYLCPFGKLQEAAGKIPVKKIKISPRTAKVFTLTRRIVFALFVVLLWVNPNFSAAEWEPFSSFLAVRDVVNFGAISVLVIAGASVVMSVFLPRAWCRVLCPTGEFLALLQRKPDYKKGMIK